MRLISWIHPRGRETVLPKDFLRPKHKKQGLFKEIFLTQLCDWHRQAYCEGEYITELEVIFETTLGGSKTAKGKRFMEKSEGKKSCKTFPLNTLWSCY